MELQRGQNDQRLPEVNFSGVISEKIKLERFNIPVTYRIATAITEPEAIIVSYIQLQGGSIDEMMLARDFGFAIKDEPERQWYQDDAEEALFKSIIFGLIEYGLVKRKKEKIFLTRKADDALSTGKKYFYYQGYIADVKFTRLVDEGFFDFQSIGLSLILIEQSKLDGADIGSHLNVSEELLTLQQKLSIIPDYDHIELVSADLPYRFVPVEIEAELHFDEFKTYTEVRVAQISNHGLSSLFNDKVNADYLYEIKREGAFRKLWASDTEITYNDLINFTGKWNFGDLIQSLRLEWNNTSVISFLVENMHVSDWIVFTTNLPAELLLKYFEDFTDNWDWHILSQRMDEDFISKRLVIKNNQLQYPWDLDELSKKSSRFIEHALWQMASSIRHSNQELSWLDFPWNWALLSESLSDNNILQGLSEFFPFHRGILSTRETEFLEQALAGEQHDKLGEWNWPVVQQRLSSAYLFRNIVKFSEFLHWKDLAIKVFDGHFTWPNEMDRVSFLKHMADHTQAISPFTTEILAWDNHLISWFDSHSLLQWSSTFLQPGFEVNASLTWDASFFEKHHNKILTIQGWRHISRKITDIFIVESNPDFKWDWNEISANVSLAWSRRLLAKFAQKLNWPVLLSRIPVADLIKLIDNFNSLGEGAGKQVKNSIWAVFNNTLPVETLLAQYHNFPENISTAALCSRDANAVINYLLETEEILLGWNWESLATHSNPANIIRLLPILNQYYFLNHHQEDLGFIQKFWIDITPRLDHQFIIAHALTYRNDWDWKYLSRNLDGDIIRSSMEAWKNKLDWIYLTEQEISSESIKPMITTPVTVTYLLYWPHIVNKALSPQELISRLPELAKIINRINDKTIKKETWLILTKRIPLEGIFPELVNGQNWPRVQLQRNLHFDWAFLSEDERLIPHLTIKFIDRYKDFWDWSLLSRNTYINDDWNYLKSFRSKWDWTYISRYSRFIKPKRRFADSKKTYQDFHSNIDWAAFSHREDLQFEHSLLVKYHQKNWDWVALSSSKMLQIDAALLELLPDKPWDWKLLSGNPALSIDTEFIINFADKDWDWTILSGRKDLIPEVKLYKTLIDKPWDYSIISYRTDFDWTAEMFRLIGGKQLDWTFISSSKRVLWDNQILSSFKSKINWNLLSANESFPIGAEWFDNFIPLWNFKILSNRKDLVEYPELIITHREAQWDWKGLSAREDINFSTDDLHALAEFLSWNNLSVKQWQRFESNWLITFRERWNWILLSDNHSVIRDSRSEVIIKEFFEQHSELEFCRRLQMQYSPWKGYIYHFAHLTNAADIILSGEILSRHRAESLKSGFANAAGSVVARRGEAHKYARFYFRPQTPTQFYNEMLGMSEHNKYYQRALLLGLPKCPVPVFFRFPIKEVLLNNTGQCFASDGNMQTNWAKVHPIDKTIIDRFDFEFLYMTPEKVKHLTRLKVGGYDPEYFNQVYNSLFRRQQAASQQEFLVRDNFQLKTVAEIEIIVPNENARYALLELIGEDHSMANNIIVDSGSLNIFHFNNPSIDYVLSGDELQYSTTYSRSHELVFETDNANLTEIIDGYPLKKGLSQLTAQKRIILKINPAIPFKLKFRDEKKQEWLIFDHKN